MAYNTILNRGYLSLCLYSLNEFSSKNPPVHDSIALEVIEYQEKKNFQNIEFTVVFIGLYNQSYVRIALICCSKVQVINLLGIEISF